MPGSYRRQLAVQVHDRVARIEEADEADGRSTRSATAPRCAP